MTSYCICSAENASVHSKITNFLQNNKNVILQSKLLSKMLTFYEKNAPDIAKFYNYWPLNYY